jgi:hypothetical protein
MTRAEIIQLLKDKGFKREQIELAKGGIYVKAEKRVPMYEFDYNEFFFKALDERVPSSKVHFLDPWTFSIECE